MAAICLNKIKYWNDSRIANANPLAAPHLPREKIILVQQIGSCVTIIADEAMCKLVENYCQEVHMTLRLHLRTVLMI